MTTAASTQTVSARDVSTYIVSRLATGRQLETIKLQKLLFFCQGWSYGSIGNALFDEDFEAWKYGPVIRDIYNLHARETDVGAAFNFSGDVDNLSHTQRQLIDAVIDTYGGINTFKLVDLTHQPGTPWFIAHYPDGDTESPQYSAPIPKESIRQYFQQEAKRVKAGGQFIT